MSDWLPILLLSATYGLTFVVRGDRAHARRLRPQFDPVLPTPKRPQLKLVRGALSGHAVTLQSDIVGDRHAS
jgi:hypothetical protein